MGVTVRITPTAWMKMQTLVMGYDKEVGWFGTCEKCGPLEYRIKDILIFPQYTSSCFVDDERDDPLEFRKWLDTLSDDEYNSRRLWGHSHVNMGTSPSGTDNDMFKRFAHTSCAPGCDNNFAICLILNKRCDMHWWVFDGETNIEYKDKAVSAMIEVDDNGLSNLEYFEESKTLVRDIRSTTAFLFNKGAYGSSYGSYYGGVNRDPAPSYNYGGYNTYANEKKNEAAAKETPKPVATATPAVTPAKKEEPAKPAKKEEPEDMTPYVSRYSNWNDWEELYSDEYDYDDNPFGQRALAYDVVITEDSIEVTEVKDPSVFDRKNEIILTEEISGDEFRFTVTDKELVKDHPVDTDSVAMVLVDTYLATGIEYFSLWEETDATHVRAIDALDESEVCDLMTRIVSETQTIEGVVEIIVKPEEVEVVA